jgi:hypothetical protein
MSSVYLNLFGEEEGAKFMKLLGGGTQAIQVWEPLVPTNDRPTLSSERAPQENKDHNSQHVGLKIRS